MIGANPFCPIYARTRVSDAIEAEAEILGDAGTEFVEILHLSSIEDFNEERVL
jgi:hypothetical protein